MAVRNRKKRTRAFIPLLIFISVAFIYLFVPFSFAKVKLEHAIYENKREEIVLAVKRNDLICDGIGNIRLPFGCRRISVDGNAHVVENSEHGIIVGFWSHRGLHMNPYRMVVYTSYDKPPCKDTLGIIRSYEYIKLGENWYYVIAY
jgi:hypothetical protein